MKTAILQRKSSGQNERKRINLTLHYIVRRYNRIFPRGNKSGHKKAKHMQKILKYSKCKDLSSLSSLKAFMLTKF